MPPLAEPGALHWHGEEALSIGQGPGHLCQGTHGSWDKAEASSCSNLGGCSSLAEHRQPGGGQCSFSHQPKAPALPTAFASWDRALPRLKAEVGVWNTVPSAESLMGQSLLLGHNAQYKKGYGYFLSRVEAEAQTEGQGACLVNSRTRATSCVWSPRWFLFPLIKPSCLSQ